MSTPNQFKDLNMADRTKRAIRAIAKRVVYEEYPRPRWASVVSIDIPNRQVTVEYPDDVANDFVAKCRSILPTTVGQVVQIGGPAGRPYVSDVIGQASVGQVTGTVTYGTNWTNFGSTWGGITCTKIGERVYLDGLVKRVTAATSGTVTVMTVPLGFRPPADYILSPIAGPTVRAARINIRDTGVLEWDTSNGVAAINDWIALAGHSFPVA